MVIVIVKLANAKRASKHFTRKSLDWRVMLNSGILKKSLLVNTVTCTTLTITNRKLSHETIGQSSDQ
jgi:hypothetical protein